MCYSIQERVQNGQMPALIEHEHRLGVLVMFSPKDLLQLPGGGGFELRGVSEVDLTASECGEFGVVRNTRGLSLRPSHPLADGAACLHWTQLHCEASFTKMK